MTPTVSARFGRASTKLIELPLIGLLALAALFGPPATREMAEPCSTLPSTLSGSSEQPWVQDAPDRRSSPVAASRLEPDATPAGDVYGGAGFSSFSTFDALAVVRRALYTGPSIGYTGPSIGGEQDLAAVPTEFDSRDILGGDFQQFAVPRLMFQQFAVPVLMPRYSTLAMARINGGPGNAYARGQWAVDWGEGTYYRSEMSVLLPHGFYAHQQGAVQVMGWDTFPVLDNHMRLIVWEQDQRARLYLKSDGVDSILTSAFTIPEGRWTRLVVEQRIATVDGWSRVYMDGQLVAHGSGSTSTGYPITRMRYGLVAIDEAAQSRPLSIWLRDVLLVTLPPEAHFAALGQTRC